MGMLEPVETEVQSRPGAFRRIASVPVSSAQAPADLDAGREWCLEDWDGQPDDPRHEAGGFNPPASCRGSFGWLLPALVANLAASATVQ
jgi:hypothetical protein